MLNPSPYPQEDESAHLHPPGSHHKAVTLCISVPGLLCPLAGSIWVQVGIEVSSMLQVTPP